MIRTRNFRLTVILKKETEGGYSAQVIELLGCISQGENRNEALANIKEAIEGYMGAFQKKSDN